MTRLRAAFLTALLVAAGSVGTPLHAQPPSLTQYDFTGGLNLQAPAHLIKDNQVADCHNVLFDDPPGAIRQRLGSVVYNSTPIVSGAPVRGLWNWYTPAGAEQLLAVSSNVFAFSTGAGNFTSVITTINPAGLVNGAAGLGNFWVVDQLDATGKFDGTTWSTVTAAPKGQVVAVYKNRVWVGNTSTEPARLFGSLFLDGTNWNLGGLPTDPVALTFGINDNGPITALVPFTDVLLVFKQRTIYGLFGSDQQDFTIRVLSHSVGCADQRSVVAKDGAIWFHSARGLELFDGTKLTLISNDVRPLTDVTRLQGNGLTAWTLDTQADFATGTMLYTDTATVPGVIQGPGGIRDDFNTLSPAWSSTQMTFDLGQGLMYPLAANVIGVAQRPWRRAIAIEAGTKVQSGFQFELIASANLAPFKAYVLVGFDGESVSPYTATQPRFEHEIMFGGGDFLTNLNTVSIVGYAKSVPRNNSEYQVYRVYSTSAVAAGVADGTFHKWRVDELYTADLSTVTVKVYRDFVFIASTTYAAFGSLDLSSAAFQTPQTLSFRMATNNMYGIPYTFGIDSMVALSFATATWTSPSFVITSTPTAWSTFSTFDTQRSSIQYMVKSASSSALLAAAAFTNQTPDVAVVVGTNTYIQWVASFTPTGTFDDFGLTGTKCQPITPATVDKVSWKWQAVAGIPVVWSTETNRFWMAFSTSASDAGNSGVLVRDRVGGFTLFRGLNAARFATFRNELYHGDSLGTGFVFRDETGTTDNGAIIVADVKTKAHALGNPDAKKRLARMRLDAVAGSSATMPVSYLPDLTTMAFSLGSWNPNEDVGVIHAKFPFPFNVPNRARFAQFQFGNGGTSGRLDLNGFTVESQELPTR